MQVSYRVGLDRRYGNALTALGLAMFETRQTVLVSDDHPNYRFRASVSCPRSRKARDLGHPAFPTDANFRDLERRETLETAEALEQAAAAEKSAHAEEGGA